MDDLANTIRQFILTNHLPGERPENLTDDTPLQTSGILDSLAMLGLVTFVEKTCGVEFSALELTIEQFDTIADVTRLVAGKRPAVGA